MFCKEFTDEIKKRKSELEKTHARLTSYWMDGMFQGTTNARIGRTLDFINKSIEQLNALLE